MTPKKPTVPLWERPTFLYRAYCMKGGLIYVGISDNWRNRLNGHRKASEWWQYAHHIEVSEYPDRHTAFAAESWFICQYSPPMNFEQQTRHRPEDLPQPSTEHGHKVHRRAFNGDEIPCKPFPWRDYVA